MEMAFGNSLKYPIFFLFFKEKKKFNLFISTTYPPFLHLISYCYCLLLLLLPFFSLVLITLRFWESFVKVNEWVEENEIHYIEENAYKKRKFIYAYEITFLLHIFTKRLFFVSFVLLSHPLALKAFYSACHSTLKR